MLLDSCHTGFQFHKVRLKVLNTPVNIVCKVFQFHKVRLKGPVFPHTYANLNQFQFHKVRLKVILESTPSLTNV